MFHLAERNLKPLLPASTLDYMAPWFRMAASVLDQQAGGLAAWRDKVRVLAPGLPALAPAIDGGVQHAVTQALLGNKRLTATYRAREAETARSYEISPLALVVRDQMQYLVCTLRDYADIKQLALNRMQAASVLDKPARPSPQFDIDQYIAQGEFGFAVGQTAAVRLVAEIDRAASQGFIERPLHEDQTVQDVDEQTVRLSVTVPDNTEKRRWLLGFGPRARVLELESLRQEMHVVVRRMLQRYDCP